MRPTNLAKLLLAATAILLAGPSHAAAERIPGVDVSRFQGKIKWKKVARDGIEFAFVQASRGKGNDCAVAPDRCGPDEYYERNYRRARRAGVRVGPYHRAFAGGGRPHEMRADARREAKLFLFMVGELRPKDLLPALDLETPFGDLGERDLRRWTRIWLRKVERSIGVKPLIYTNTSSWARTGDTLGFAKKGHKLWVANWNVPRPSVPARNWAGNGWSVWQHTSSGRVAGIAGNVDRNHARVPLDELSVRPPPEPGGGIPPG